MASDTQPSLQRRLYRVEYRDKGETQELGRVSDILPHPTSLAPWVSRLLMEGRTGEVVLIEEETEQVVARHSLRRPSRWYQPQASAGLQRRPLPKRLGGSSG